MFITLSGTPRPRLLHDITIQRRLITHSQQLILTILLPRLSLTNLIPPLIDRPVRNANNKSRRDPRRQNPQRKAVAQPIMRFLLFQENIRANRTAQVSDRDQQRHADGALPRRREVVADPAQDAYDGRVDACGDGEKEGVCEAWEARVRDC